MCLLVCVACKWETPQSDSLRPFSDREKRWPSEDTSSIDGGREERWVEPEPPPHKKAWAQVYFLESLFVNVKAFPFESKCEHQHLLLSVFLSNSSITKVAPWRRPLGVHPALLFLLLPSLHPSLLSSLWSMFHKGTWKGLRWPGRAKEAPKLHRWTSQRVQEKGPDLATCHPTGQRGTYSTSGLGYKLLSGLYFHLEGELMHI